MANRPKIDRGPVENGIMEIRLQNWKYFNKFVTQSLLRFPGYVYRGHANSEWSLETTLDRLQKNNPNGITISEQAHLQAFKFASRGRRNGYSIPYSENDWWSLGQHYGLATPLLDFTRSPYVALYFAFFEDHEGSHRTVYALHMRSIQKRKEEILKDNPGGEYVDIFTPMTEENQRLLNQAGLFLRLPPRTSLEQWVESNFSGFSENAVLIKMIIPNRMQEDCLVHLNKSNINHLTLFPDLFGATQHTNLLSSILHYDSLGYL